MNIQNAGHLPISYTGLTDAVILEQVNYDRDVINFYCYSYDYFKEAGPSDFRRVALFTVKPKKLTK